MDKVLTRESLKEAFEKINTFEYVPQKTIMSSGAFASMWAPEIMITLTPEQQEEERIANKNW